MAAKPFEHVIGVGSLAKQFEWIIVEPSNASCAVTGNAACRFFSGSKLQDPKGRRRQIASDPDTGRIARNTTGLFLQANSAMF